MNRYLLLSIILHILILGSLGLPSCSKKGGFAKYNSENRKILDKSIEVSVIEHIPQKPKKADFIEKKKKQKKKAEKIDCKYFIGGIGIYITFAPDGSETISDISNGYPAQVAGLRVGDKIISPRHPGIKGKIGTEVYIMYERDGGIHGVSLVRDKICLSEEKKK